MEAAIIAAVIIVAILFILLYNYITRLRFERKFREWQDAEVLKWEKEIEQASSPRRQLEELVANLFSGGKTTRFTDQSIEIKATSGADIGLDSLSSGEKHLLMVFVDTLLAERNSMLIDEPEISMHVDWQRELVSSMHELNRESQIIAATHSPEILVCVDESKIFRI